MNIEHYLCIRPSRIFFPYPLNLFIPLTSSKKEWQLLVFSMSDSFGQNSASAFCIVVLCFFTIMAR